METKLINLQQIVIFKLENLRNSNLSRKERKKEFINQRFKKEKALLTNLFVFFWVYKFISNQNLIRVDHIVYFFPFCQKFDISFGLSLLFIIYCSFHSLHQYKEKNQNS